MQSYICLFRLLEVAAHGRIVHTQVIGDLSQPIPMPAIRVTNESRRCLLPCKEHPQRRSAGLCLATWDLSNHAIGLMLRNELVGAEVDLALELFPRARPLSSLRHKLTVASLRFALP